MKRIESNDAPRQELWEHEGKTYSIVDLIIPPLEANGERAGGKFIDLMYEMYHPYRYELARFNGERVVVLGRYISFSRARRAIKEPHDEE
jgi:hypothetical protein